MLFAVFMAVALHVCLMNFEFGPEQVSVPIVSLPRSVSVFLGQKHKDDKQDQQKANTQNAKPLVDDQAVETESEINVVPESSTVAKKKNNRAQRPVLSGKTVKPVEIVEEKILPAAAESMPVNQRAENTNSDPHAVVIQKNTTTNEPQTVQEERGAPRAGTLQMAYPRYQLNNPPPYPALARKRGQEGTVILRVLVNSGGRVDDLKIDVSSNFSLLDRAAEKSVQKWNFEPGKRGKERISMWVKVPITFKLKK